MPRSWLWKDLQRYGDAAHMNCMFSDSIAGAKCKRCGYALLRDYNSPPRRNCVPPGIGDRVAKWLAAVGVTEARWLAIKGIVIEKPTCGCEKRKETLNRWGRWLASWKKPFPPVPPAE